MTSTPRSDLPLAPTHAPHLLLPLADRLFPLPPCASSSRSFHSVPLTFPLPSSLLRPRRLLPSTGNVPSHDPFQSRRHDSNHKSYTRRPFSPSASSLSVITSPPCQPTTIVRTSSSASRTVAPRNLARAPRRHAVRDPMSLCDHRKHSDLDKLRGSRYCLILTSECNDS